MAGRKSAEKALRWREILTRQVNSGLSIRQFCATEGISEQSFYGWRKKLGEPKQSDSRALAAGCRQGSGSGPLFVPLQLLDNSAALEIIHPLGYRIQMNGEVDPIALRHVIEALDERGAP